MLSRRLLLKGSTCVLTVAAAGGTADADLVTDPGADLVTLRAGRDGFGGAVPGPLLTARQGGEARVRLVNDLDEPLALRWHGVRLPARSAPAAPVPPGGSVDYRLFLKDAGTFWYRAARPSQHGAGLYGALIVAEPSPPPVDRDIALIFDGRPPGDGPALTIDGAPAADIAVRQNERLRLRFINASLAGVMEARIAGHRAVVMALDGEPAEPFVTRDGAVVLHPGNRADVFVDAVLAPGSAAPLTFFFGGGEAAAVRLVYLSAPARPAPPPEAAPLPQNPLPARMSFSRAMRVTLAMDAAPALFTTGRGRTVVMALANRGAAAQCVYVEGHHFRLLDRLDDGWKPYWLDTVAVAGGETVRIAFVADTPGRFLIESRPLGGLDTAAPREDVFEVR